VRILASTAASQAVPGVLGFLVVAAMALALYFLLRSMNKHLRKVVREPRWRGEAEGEEGQEPGDGGDEPQDQPDYSRNGSGQA
jgi:hypothetical protein